MSTNALQRTMLFLNRALWAKKGTTIHIDRWVGTRQDRKKVDCAALRLLLLLNLFTLAF